MSKNGIFLINFFNLKYVLKLITILNKIGSDKPNEFIINSYNKKGNTYATGQNECYKITDISHVS